MCDANLFKLFLGHLNKVHNFIDELREELDQCTVFHLEICCNFQSAISS